MHKVLDIVVDFVDDHVMLNDTMMDVDKVNSTIKTAKRQMLFDRLSEKSLHRIYMDCKPCLWLTLVPACLYD